MQKRHEDREYEEQGQSGLGEGLFQTYQTMPNASAYNRFDRRDEELEQKDKERRLVRDLKLEARGRRWKRDHEE